MVRTYLNKWNNPDMPEVIMQGDVRFVQEMRLSVRFTAS